MALRSASSGMPSALGPTWRNVTAPLLHCSGSGTSSTSPGSTGRLICHHVRTWSNPALRSQTCWRLSSANAPLSICCTASPRAAPTRTACASAHANRAAAHWSASSSAIERSTTCTNSILPSARSWTLPQATIRSSASRTTTFWRIAVPGSAISARRSSSPAPAQPRPASSWVRLSWVSRETADSSTPVSDQPVGSEGGEGNKRSGSVSNRLSSGITGPLCRVSSDAVKRRLSRACGLRPGAARRRARRAVRRSRTRARRPARSPRPRASPTPRATTPARRRGSRPDRPAGPRR